MIGKSPSSPNSRDTDELHWLVCRQHSHAQLTTFSRTTHNILTHNQHSLQERAAFRGRGGKKILEIKILIYLMSSHKLYNYFRRIFYCEKDQFWPKCKKKYFADCKCNSKVPGMRMRNTKKNVQGSSQWFAATLNPFNIPDSKMNERIGIVSPTKRLTVLISCSNAIILHQLILISQKNEINKFIKLILYYGYITDLLYFLISFYSK